MIFAKNEKTRNDKLSAHLESNAKNDWQSTQNMKKGVYTQKKSRNDTEYLCDIDTKKSWIVPLRILGRNVWESIQHKGNI